MGGKNLFRRPLRRAADDPHALASMQDPLNRAPREVYDEPDEIEWPCCTAEYRDGAFRHERSCVMRRAG